MPRCSILFVAERESLLALPGDDDHHRLQNAPGSLGSDCR